MSTRTESRSTTGGEIGAALAISMQENPPAAEAVAMAADAFRNSRRLRFIISTPGQQDCALFGHSMSRQAITRLLVLPKRLPSDSGVTKGAHVGLWHSSSYPCELASTDEVIE